MEVSILALEKLLKENEQKISNCSIQLRELEAGNIKLSPMKVASVENTLEEATKAYEKYKELYDQIPQNKKDQLHEQIQLQEALAKQSYYKLQKIRLKHSKNITRDQRLEAMMILDELPSDIHFDDKELLDIANTVIHNNIRDVVELEQDLQEIKNDFETQLERLEDEKDLKHFAFLDNYIPIIILHFKTLIENIKSTIEQHNENLTEEEKPLTFKGLPKYEDWWIEELFQNHQAYFALYKFKDIVANIAITDQQKILWEKIFTNWVMIKKILNNKDENGYEYNMIFDNLLAKYGEFEEELDIDNLKSMENIVYNITKNEDFTHNKTKHQINTTYLQYKSEKLNSANS